MKLMSRRPLRAASRQMRTSVAFAILVALPLLVSCERPTSDQSVLMAIKAESRTLMAAYPPKESTSIPKNSWPPAIASLQPESVTVYRQGIDIKTKPGFDGGYGYEVPRNDKRDLLMPPACYSELGQGVFWHGPC